MTLDLSASLNYPSGNKGPAEIANGSMNRILEQQQPTAPAGLDPHQPRSMPAFALVRVHAEPGTLCRFRDHRNGLLDLYIRAPMLAAWPPHVPDLEPGEQVYQIRPPHNIFYVQSPLVMPPEHAFEPSILDERECRICQLPTHKVWVLSIVRQGEGQQPQQEQHSFATQEGGLAARQGAAADPRVIAMSLQEMSIREDTYRNGEAHAH